MFELLELTDQSGLELVDILSFRSDPSGRSQTGQIEIKDEFS